MKKGTGKKITLEDLSSDIKGLGESLGSRINVMEVAMGNLEGTVNSLEDKVVGLEVTVDNLAIAVARGFENVDKRFERLEGDFDQFKDETEDNFKKVRNDILEIGDKFVPWHHFDELSHRVDTQNMKGEKSN